MSSLPVEVLRRQFVTLWPLLSKAQKNGDFVFEYGKSKNLFEGITVQTACSGTDGPVIALQIFKEIATELRKRQETLCGEHWKFDYQHVMSCEIVPFKQAYLVRNFEDVKVFADIKEIAKSEAKTAFGGTVSGFFFEIFFQNTSCKDFSTLRTSGKLDMLESKGISGETFFAACEFIFSQAQNWIIFENVDGAPWEQMEQYITGRLPLWSLYDKAKSGKKCGDLESTQNKSKENSQIMFTLSQDGRWETTHVPPKNGCRLGGILYAIDRGYTQRGHTADVGTTMTIEQLASHLDCEMTLDTFVFEGPKDLLTGEIVFYRSQVVKCDTKEYGLPQVRRRKYMFVYRLDWVADIQDDLDEAGIDLGELFEELVECMQEPVNYALTAYVPDDTDPKVRRMRDRLRGPVGRKTARDELRNNSYYYNLTANVKHGVKMRNDCNLIERCDKDFSTKPITGWGERGKSKSIMYNLWPCMWDTVMTQRRRDMIDIFAMNQSAPVVLKHSDKCHDSLHTGYIWDLSQNATITTPHPATPGCSGCITPAGLSFLPQFGRMLTGGEKLAFQGIPIDRLQLGQETEMQLGDLAGNAMSLTVISAAMLAALSVKQFARERLANKKFLLKEPVPELLVTTTFAPPEKDKNVTYQKDSKELDAVSSFHDIAKLAYEAESASVLCVCETSGGSSASSILRCSNCNFTFCRSCASRGLDLACHKVCDYSVMHPTETSTASAGNKSRIGSVSFEQKLRCAAPSCLSLPSKTEAKLIGNSDLSDSIFYLRKVKRKRGFWELTYVAAAQTGQLLGDFICCVGRVPELSSEISNYGMTAYVRLFPKGKRGILPPVVRRHFVVDDSGNIKPSTWETRNSFSLQVEVNGSEPTPSYRKTMGNKTFQTGTMSIWPKLIEFTVTNMETKENENEYNLLNDRIFKRLSCKGTINQNAIWQSKADLKKKDDIELFILIRPSSNRTSRVNMIVCSSRDYHRQGSLLAEFPTTFMPEISMAVLRGGTQRVTTYTWTKTPQIKFIAPPQSLKISGPKDTSISGLDELVVSLPTRIEELMRTGSIKSINSWQVLKQKSNDSDNCGQWGLNTIYSPKPPPKYDGMGSNEYEKALRAVPEPWHLKVDMEKRVMEIVASPCVPCHQVAADLLIGQWRVSGSATETIITGTTTADVASTSTFKVPTSSKYVETVPQDFTGDPLKLFPRQELALTRMVSMESGNVYFTEKELRQVPFRGLPSWVMEAKASRKVKLRGGVLADVMGGGKTATIIALIARSCEESRRERKRLQEEGKPWASSATLVIVPPNLTSSWHHEVKKFTRDKLAMVVIDDTENLLKITRKKLCEADIVIVNMAILIDGSGSSFITYLSNLSKKSKFGELPIQLPKVSGFKAVDTLKGRTYVDHPANPYGGHGAQGVRGQNKRNDAAYFTSKYWESLSKLRKIKFSEDTKGIPLEWFSWTRLVFDECHEATCPPELEADFDEDEGSTKIPLAARELLGLAAEGDAERPLRARGGVWGLTGTPMLSSEDRVIELASMFRTYCIGQAKHWRRSERASRRSIDYAIARREHAQEFINFAVQRNRATEFNGEKVEKICEVSMSAETSQKFHELSPQSAFAIGMKTDEVVCKNFNEIEILREIAPARSIKVAEIVRKIHVEDPVGKVVVFAPDADEAFNAVCKALSDAPGGMSFFNDETPASQRREIISSFASVDQLESDLKNPRVLVLPFSHAAGHNFQYVSCNMILVAPLWLGDDGVRAVANEQQAIGRIFRSGQLKKCTIYRVLLCGPNGEKTIDHSLYGVNTDASNIEAATSC
eukprot:GSMAST32.ASY1.ANO1.843.1 assembled CDS